MNDDNNREIILSISSRPGLFGETVHNALYSIHKINYFYKALKVTNLEHAVKGVRYLGIRGCSVSMPFKEKIVKLLDNVDKDAMSAGAVNTVVNTNNTLTGFNTDIWGAVQSLKKLRAKKRDSVLLLGCGGVARAILIALRKKKISEIFICNRNKKKALSVAKTFSCKVLDWNKRNEFVGDILINATPLGMIGDKEMVIKKSSLDNFNKIMDVVVSIKETELIAEAKKRNLAIATGLHMTFHQAAAQYELYTGIKAPIQKMLEAYNMRFNLSINL